ncbi:MAG: tryptophan 2,3-dioxygenase family protein [archaeon]|nr:tryptophan 2,3-dioxygenase family protein [archaeon]
MASCPFGYGSSHADEGDGSSSNVPPLGDGGIYYSDYLGLDKLLTAQNPESTKAGKPAHDEMLFIIVHQTYELWFKQILHELDSIIGIFSQASIPEKDLTLVIHRMKRIDEIQRILIAQISVLETMHPLDFLDFRKFLTPASGFQSFQFRVLENKLGIKAKQRFQLQKTEYLGYFKAHHQEVLRGSEKVSLLELVQRWLERTPFLEFEGWSFLVEYKNTVTRMHEEDREAVLADQHTTEEHKQQQLKMIEQTLLQFQSLFDEEKHNELVAQGFRRISFRALQAALLISLYRDEPLLSTPFQLLTLLLQMDENISLWRYRHTQMVHRMLGSKVGTGGSSGYRYLKSTTSDRYKVFLDFYNLSSFLIPRSNLPDLPVEAKSKLGFYYSSHTQ